MWIKYDELRWIADIRFIEALDEREFTLTREQQIILYLKHLVENVLKENAALKGEEYQDPWRTWNDINFGNLPGFLKQKELDVLAREMVDAHSKQAKKDIEDTFNEEE